MHQFLEHPLKVCGKRMNPQNEIIAYLISERLKALGPDADFRARYIHSLSTDHISNAVTWTVEDLAFFSVYNRGSDRTKGILND